MCDGLDGCGDCGACDCGPSDCAGGCDCGPGCDCVGCCGGIADACAFGCCVGDDRRRKNGKEDDCAAFCRCFWLWVISVLAIFGIYSLITMGRDSGKEENVPTPVEEAQPEEEEKPGVGSRILKWGLEKAAEAL